MEAINELIKEKENIIIYFIFTDQNINTSISCFNTDLFAHVEEKLYLKHQELKNQNVVYLTNGNVVNRALTLEQNKIKNDSHILIQRD